MSKILESKVYEIDDDSSLSSNQYVEDQKSDDGFQIVKESDEEGDKMDDLHSEVSSEKSEAEESDDNDTPIPLPESLKSIFKTEGILIDYTQSAEDLSNNKMSLFSKTSKKVDTLTTSANIKD